MTADTHTERFYAAELHRLQGKLVLRKCTEIGAKPAPRDRQYMQAGSGETTGRAPLQMEAAVALFDALT